MTSLKVDGSTGIDWIDEQHGDLLAVIDRLVVMILEKTGRDEVTDQFDKYSSMWERHCQSEEAHIKHINSPRLKVMKAEHARVSARFEKLEGWYLENPDVFQDSTELFELRNLLIKHVVDFDTVELRNPHPTK